MLIFAADVEAKTAILCDAAYATDVIEAGLVGTTIVIHDRLPEMETVVKDGPTDLADARVGTLATEGKR